MAVNRNGAHIETEPRVGRSKRKAKVLVESESEGEITYVSFSLITRYTSKVLFPCSGLFFSPAHTTSAAMSITQVAFMSIHSGNHLARTVVSITNRVALLFFLLCSTFCAHHALDCLRIPNRQLPVLNLSTGLASHESLPIPLITYSSSTRTPPFNVHFERPSPIAHHRSLLVSITLLIDPYAITVEC